MTKDMTQGSPLKLILAFAVPLMLGSLFQQFYNLADTIIVGRFVGVEALAAVGSVGGLNYLVLGFVNGIACGFSIPISWTFGAKDYVEMRRYTANAVWLSVFFAAVLTVVTVAMTRSILVWTNTPDNIIDLADIYIRTIFIGIPFTLLYNMTSALMRALGDSKRPLYFLLVASFLNIGLDLLCIIVFKMGVFGAAFATVFSQAALPLLAALLAGLVLGMLTLHLSKWLGYRQYVARQALLLGGLTLLTGLGGELALLPALAALVYGLTVRNLDRHYAVTEPAPLNWTPILLIALFIFTGSQFDWRLLPQAGLVAAGYIALRLLCQWLPLVLLARRSGLHGRRTLWLALAQTPMSSGAPGLLLLPWLGSLLLPAGSMALAITVLTLTELAGPSLTQLALRQAGEASD